MLHRILWGFPEFSMFRKIPEYSRFLQACGHHASVSLKWSRLDISLTVRPHCLLRTSGGPHTSPHCQHLAADARERRLRSTESRTCVVTQNHSTFDDRAFAAVSRVLWNSLPPHLRGADLPYSKFRRSLKTFLFWQWGHGAVWTILTAPSRNNLTYLLTYQRPTGELETASPNVATHNWIGRQATESMAVVCLTQYWGSCSLAPNCGNSHAPVSACYTMMTTDTNPPSTISPSLHQMTILSSSIQWLLHTTPNQHHPMFNMSRPSKSILIGHQSDWYQYQ